MGKGGKKKTSSSSSPLDIEVVSAGLSTPQKKSKKPLSSASAENGERIDTKRKQSLQLPRSALLGAIKQLMPHVKRYFRLQVWPGGGITSELLWPVWPCVAFLLCESVRNVCASRRRCCWRGLPYGSAEGGGEGGGRDLYTCLLYLSRGERRGLLNPLQSPSRFRRRREEEEEEEEETALD